MLSLSAAPSRVLAQKPDFSGSSKLDAQASDDTESQILGGAGEDTTRGLTRLERNRLRKRLIRLARAIDEIELVQSETDLKIFDRDDNVPI